MRKKKTSNVRILTKNFTKNFSKLTSSIFKKNNLKNTNLGEFIYPLFLQIILGLGMGFFFWHLKNLDFYSFTVLFSGEKQLNNVMQAEILSYESRAILISLLSFGFIKLFSQNSTIFLEKATKNLEKSLGLFILLFIISIFIPTHSEKYFLENIHQLIFSIIFATWLAGLYGILPSKNNLNTFIEKHHFKIFVGIFAIFLFLYILVGIVKFLHIQHGGLDYTFFTQGIWHYSRLEEPIITYGGATKNLHAEHAHFFLILLAPLWMLFQSPFTLLFVDLMLMCSMAIPIYLIARKEFKSTLLPLVLVIATLFYFGIQRALEHEFHEANLIAPLFLWTFYALYKEKFKWYILGIFVLLMSKESSPIWTIFLGFYTIFFSRKYLLGGLVILASLIYFPLVIGWIIPNLLGNGVYQHFSFKDLGSTPGEVVKSILVNPVYTLRILLAPSDTYLNNIGDNQGLITAMTHMKQNTLSQMYGSFGFLSLFSPKILFLSLPMIGERFLNSDDWRWSIYLYYNVSFLPVLALGTIFGIKNLAKFTIIQKSPNFIIFISFFILSMSFLVNPKKQPMLSNIFQDNFLTFTEKEKTIWELTHLIPKNATLQTQSTILPFFAHRDYIKPFPLGLHESGEQNSPHNFWNYARHKGKMIQDPVKRDELLAQKKLDILNIKKSKLWPHIDSLPVGSSERIKQKRAYDAMNVDDLNITIADYDEHFKKLAQYYQQEPEYTILNPDFIAYPLKSKEEVEEWITKMRKTHDIFYEKAGTIVFKRKDSENMLTK
jgi:uncharacterized membrane protein